MKKSTWYQSLTITVFVFLMLWFAQKIADFKLFTAFDTIGQAMTDFEMTDYVFSQIRESPLVDERFVLVNIGTLSRREIAQQIQIINSLNPRVIAFDGIFKCNGGLRDSINCPALLDTLGNLLLADAIAQSKNFVLATKLIQTDSTSKYDVEYYDSIEYSDANIRGRSNLGFVNLPTNATHQDDVKHCRSIFPRWEVNGEEQLAFSTQIAMQYDSALTKEFLARGKKEELLNFRGNMEVMQLGLDTEKNDETGSSNFATMFYSVDAEQLLHGEFLPSLFEDRIVMMGYMGDYLGQSAWEDKFFTPLNKKVAGRANPDMFGLVVHANAVIMMLNKDYINETPAWLETAIAFVVCLLTVALFIIVDRALPTWFDALSFVIQVVELLLISSVVIFSFYFFNLKLELATALGVSALVGPCYDIFKSFQNEYRRRVAKRKLAVATAEEDVTKTSESV